MEINEINQAGNEWFLLFLDLEFLSEKKIWSCVKCFIGGQPLIFFGQQTRKENEWESTFQYENMFILLYDENYRIQRTASHAKLGQMKIASRWNQQEKC